MDKLLTVVQLPFRLIKKIKWYFSPWRKWNGQILHYEGFAIFEEEKPNNG